jgi:hypothetical protein
MATKKKNMMIGFLCTRLKMDKEMKEDMIYSHTNGRSCSTKDLFENEAGALIQFLVNQSALPQDDKWKMKRKMLSLAHDLHWEVAGGRVDMERVNAWCIRHTGAKKPLDKLSYTELVSAVTGLESYYRQFLKGI